MTLNPAMKRFPWHPLLFAIFPVVSLFAQNVGEIKPAEAVRSLALAFCLGAMLFLMARYLIKDADKAAVMAVLALLAFFSYGRVYQLLKNVNLAAMTVGRHRLIAPLYLVGFGLGLYWISRSKRDWHPITQAMNMMAIVALALPLFQITLFYARQAQAGASEPVSGSASLHVAQNSPLPDIYYIILNAYARDDVLKDFYGYDNSAFLDELTGLGFHVAYCSQSNYGQTRLSLSSSLNMDYIPA